jgi:HEAT repeat protein
MVVYRIGPTGDEDLPVLLGGLSDPAVEVRVTAAAALARYRGAGVDRVRESLRAAMTDPGEDLDVRAQAWKALVRYRLEGQVYEEWREMRRLLERLGSP